MPLPPLTYLAVDSMADGVAQSQILPYVERLAQRGVDVTLHTFERGGPNDQVGRRLADAGVSWRPHSFGSPGSAGGIARVCQGALALSGAELVHARSDLAAAAAILGRSGRWVWDMRAFWREQRIAQGLLRPGSPQERIMRIVESRAARSSAGVVTLSHAAIDELARRFGAEVRTKCRVITTCVDLERFPVTALPPGHIRLLLAGTLNALYDVPAMVRLVALIQGRRRTDLTVLTPDPREWESLLRSVGAVISSAAPAEMQDHVRAHHVGLSLLRPECGESSRAAVPTKLGEFLASGRPIVVSARMGDLDAMLASHECGVVVDDTSAKGLERAADEIDRLLNDDDLPARCRQLAEEHFDLEKGVDRLIALYDDVVRSEPHRKTGAGRP